MALDGTVISCMAWELNHALAGGKINKIAQPEKDELMLTIKNNRKQYRLLVSASASLPLVYLTDQNKTGPMTAPNFCMLLRKHIGSGRILRIWQPGMERILNMEIEHLNELGDICRKLLIIDGKAAFTGGVNLADEYINEYKRFGHWKDCGILVRGKAVWSMTVMFLSLWGYVDRSEEDVSRFRADYPEKRGGTGFLQPFADSPLDNEDVGATILQSVISSAQERMWIMTPYLILDDKMTTALCVAAKTGVDVRIITPGIPDKWYVHAVTRANYEELTRAGVRIFEYTPGFIHSKVYLADTKQAVVGTVNLDFRSLYLHFEDAVYLYDTTVNAQVQADFEETLPQCREITAEQCRHTHLTQRVLRALLRLLAPLM